MKRSRQIFLSVLTVLAVCLYAAAPQAVYAEETPSGDNTDGGSISLDLVHYQAQSLTLQLNSDHLAYQDVTLDCVDSETGKPVTISLLAAPGSQEYTLYDLDAPVEELTGTLNISMITEPGYELDLDAAVFTINGQTYSNGSSAVITAPSASVGSSIVCREAAAEFPEEPEAPAEPEVPTQPQAPETAETPSEPENQESHQETLSDPEPQPTPDTSLSEEAPAETQNFASPESSADTRTSPGAYQAETSETDIPELLTVTPITGCASETAQNSEAVPADHPSAGAAAGSPAETFRSSDASVLESSADTVLSSEAQTKELPSGVHTSDRIRQINFVLAVLTLIVLILLLTRLILTLKRERRNRQYRRYR